MRGARKLSKKIDTIVVDKTGTLTGASLKLVSVEPERVLNSDGNACACGRNSKWRDEHPLAARDCNRRKGKRGFRLMRHRIFSGDRE